MDTNRRDSRAHPGKKPGKVDLFLAGLTSQRTVELASKYAGIAASTGYRWLRDPAIAERRRQAGRDASQHAQARLRETMCAAVDRLRTLVDKADSEAVQVAACKAVLDYNLKASEIEDLQEQINEIKKIFKSESLRWNNGSAQYHPTSPADRANEEIN
jgi:hypothetical protein